MVTFFETRTFPYVSRTLNVRLLSKSHVEAETATCWKYSLENPISHFLSGSTFQHEGEAVSTGLTFVNLLFIQFKLTRAIFRF